MVQESFILWQENKISEVKIPRFEKGHLIEIFEALGHKPHVETKIMRFLLCFIV